MANVGHISPEKSCYQALKRMHAYVSGNLFSLLSRSGCAHTSLNKETLALTI